MKAKRDAEGERARAGEGRRKRRKRKNKIPQHSGNVLHLVQFETDAKQTIRTTKMNRENKKKIDNATKRERMTERNEAKNKSGDMSTNNYF